MTLIKPGPHVAHRSGGKIADHLSPLRQRTTSVVSSLETFKSVTFNFVDGRPIDFRTREGHTGFVYACWKPGAHSLWLPDYVQSFEAADNVARALPLWCSSLLKELSHHFTRRATMFSRSPREYRTLSFSWSSEICRFRIRRSRSRHLSIFGRNKEALKDQSRSRIRRYRESSTFVLGVLVHPT